MTETYFTTDMLHHHLVSFEGIRYHSLQPNNLNLKKMAFRLNAFVHNVYVFSHNMGLKNIFIIITNYITILQRVPR